MAQTVPTPGAGAMQEAASPVHDQAFFLALAREGRDAWNKWRHANANVAITFEGVDFEAAGTGVNFRRFEFGDHANFSGATFGHRARFAGARFGEEASFRCATFGDAADFEGVTFGDRADLSNAAFGDTADFRRASFGNSAGLRGTTFGYWTKLSRVKFEGRAFLSGVILGDRTTLSEAIFKSDVDLRAMSNEEWQREISQVLSRSSLTQSWPDERKRKFLADREILHRSGAGPNAFGRICFAGAVFEGSANFSGRRFSDGCDFRAVRFKQPPIFDECEGMPRFDLYGARITFFGTLFEEPFADTKSPFFAVPRPLLKVPGWTTQSEVAIRLRLLRGIAEDTKNHDLERDLYIEERKAERGVLLARYFHDGWSRCPDLVAHCLWIAIMGIYWLLSDYGRSVLRPLVAIIASVFLFHAAYSKLLSAPDAAAQPAFGRAVWAFTIANAVPFVGALTLDKDVKEVLLCTGVPRDNSRAAETGARTCNSVPTVAFQLVALGQSILSALLVFFLALALRNFFKLH